MTMKSIPLFPLGQVLFPNGLMHLHVFELRYLQMIRRCIADQAPFGVVFLLEGNEVQKPGVTETLATVGTLAHIQEWHDPMPGLLRIRCTGTSRFQLLSAQQGDLGLWRGTIRDLPASPALELPEKYRQMADYLGQLLSDMQQQSGGAAAAPLTLTQPFLLNDSAWVADRWAELLPLAGTEKQRLLTMQNPLRRLKTVHQLLQLHKIIP